MKTLSLVPTWLLSAMTVLLLPVASHGIPTSGSLAAGHALSPSPAAFSTPLTPSPAGAPLHGISVRLAPEGRVVVATCRYDGGTPVAGANVTLFAPGGDAPFLTGTTDPAGFFAFLPNSTGRWRIVVDDGMGHRREARIEVTAAAGAPAGADDERVGIAGHPGDAEHGGHADHAHDADHEHLEAPSAQAGSVDDGFSREAAGSDRPWRLATGLSLILGLTGFSYGFTARRPRT